MISSQSISREGILERSREAGRVTNVSHRSASIIDHRAGAGLDIPDESLLAVISIDYIRVVSSPEVVVSSIVRTFHGKLFL